MLESDYFKGVIWCCLKKTLFFVFGVMQCVLTFSTRCTLLLLYALSFWNTLIFTKLIVLRSEACSDWPALQCVVIGRIPQAWDGNVTPLTVLWCSVPAWWHKTIKPIINEAFVASSGDIFRCCIASRRVNITLSAFVIGETTNNKHYSTLLKTHIWIVCSRNVLQAVSQKHQTVLAKLELPHFIETVFVQVSIVVF